MLDADLQRAGIAQSHRHEGAEQGQVPPRELIAEYGWVSRHEPPVPELGARVTGLGDLVEHDVIGEQLLVETLDFEGSPGNGGVGNANPAGRHPVTSRLSASNSRPISRSFASASAATGVAAALVSSRANSSSS